MSGAGSASACASSLANRLAMARHAFRQFSHDQPPLVFAQARPFANFSKRPPAAQTQPAVGVDRANLGAGA